MVRSPGASGRRAHGAAAAWRAVLGFGGVSLTADMVYEGARSVTGPLLQALGASSLTVGLVTGAGESAGLGLRLLFGPMADRTGRYWTFAIGGYATTAICVPMLALSPLLGGAGPAFAITLILLERFGKAVRSPAKSALLADAAAAVGTGHGFGVHKAMDEVGAVSGPLLVAAVIAATGLIWPAMALLAVPGAVAIALLLWIRARMLHLAHPSHPIATAVPDDVGPSWWADLTGSGLGLRFFMFAGCAGLATSGLVTFGVISFHLAGAGVVGVAAVPLVYAAAQGASAIMALVTGFGYDRVGATVLYLLPLLVAAIPVLAFSRTAWVAILGALAWGAAHGLQDSTVKALVADLVARERRATAYGVFAAVQGAAAISGGALAGWLYQTSLPTLTAVVAVLQLGTLVLLGATLAGGRRHPGRAG